MDVHKPLRVLFVVPSLKRGGAETQLVTLVNDLPGEEFEKHVLSFEAGDEQRSRLAPEVRVHHSPRGRRFDFSFADDIAEYIRRHDIDLVHTTLQMGLLAGWLGARRSGQAPPLLAALHTTNSRSLKHAIVKRLVYRHMLKSAAMPSSSRKACPADA